VIHEGRDPTRDAWLKLTTNDHLNHGAAVSLVSTELDRAPRLEYIGFEYGRGDAAGVRPLVATSLPESASHGGAVVSRLEMVLDTVREAAVTDAGRDSYEPYGATRPVLASSVRLRAAKFTSTPRP
jgi:hypothetical protein